ncbi:hypothetical protein ABZ568_00705 [Streptomyces olindensis]|uniref:Uncharacterized protein n=1 Tax=Streptomyces olindensis TaxID=358823 RepID=A0ABV2XLV4_9ACTN
MDAKHAISILTDRAESEIDAAKKTRQRLIKGCELDGSQLDHLMEAVLLADATAKPWVELMQRIDRHGVREGLAKQIQKATENLVVYGIALSTSMVTNAARLHEVEGLRRFLSFTQGMDIDDETPAEEPAPAPEPQSAPAPTPVNVPKATPAQKRTLEAIRDNGVKLQEFRVGQLRVAVNDGEKPRKDMILWVIEQGWALRDHSTSLYTGQPVSLTQLGEAILAR